MSLRLKWLTVLLALACGCAIRTVGRAKAEVRSNGQDAATPGVDAKKPKRHQATGIVIRLTDTSIVVARGRGKQKMNWSFVRNEKTKTIGLLTRAAKVTVYYHEENGKRIAERIKVLEAATPSPASSQPPASKPKS